LRLKKHDVYTLRVPKLGLIFSGGSTVDFQKSVAHRNLSSLKYRLRVVKCAAA